MSGDWPYRLREHRGTLLAFGGVGTALAVISTISPSIRRPPSLRELDDLAATVEA